ncbi:MAG: GNAT family N-acetyltransferase [Vampirovibrionales bacterium]
MQGYLVNTLKRLFVLPKAQGAGIGKALMAQAINDAYTLGYTTMYLDSLERLEGAKALYQRFGFYRVEPYNTNPYHDVYYMALDLSSQEPHGMLRGGYHDTPNKTLAPKNLLCIT